MNRNEKKRKTREMEHGDCIMRGCIETVRKERECKMEAMARKKE